MIEQRMQPMGSLLLNGVVIGDITKLDVTFKLPTSSWPMPLPLRLADFEVTGEITAFLPGGEGGGTNL